MPGAYAAMARGETAASKPQHSGTSQATHRTPRVPASRIAAPPADLLALRALWSGLGARLDKAHRDREAHRAAHHRVPDPAKGRRLAVKDGSPELDKQQQPDSRKESEQIGRVATASRQNTHEEDTEERRGKSS